MTEHDYTPPADEIEREARAVHESGLSNNYSCAWSEAHGARLAECRAMARRNLRERHERDEALFAGLKQSGYGATAIVARMVLANLDAPPVAEPTLAEAVERYIGMNTNHEAFEAMRAALARERGK